MRSPGASAGDNPLANSELDLPFCLAKPLKEQVVPGYLEAAFSRTERWEMPTDDARRSRLGLRPKTHLRSMVWGLLKPSARRDWVESS